MARPWPIAFFAAGTGLIFWRAALAVGGENLPIEDSLALTTLAFLLMFGGICCWTLGRRTLRARVFPLAFLTFMVPLPVDLRTYLETLLQYGSSAAAYGFFRLSGMPVLQNGVVFHLPGFSLQVAPECSGIHSSLALFITSVVAGHLFLRARWKQVALALAVIPLALLRNGFRVFVIGQLCVRIGPQMIDSYIHRHGGPIFFVLSLIPFCLLLWLLAKPERNSTRIQASSSLEQG
jgi:exosortase C (VPDSG-CTERM-specific)